MDASIEPSAVDKQNLDMIVMALASGASAGAGVLPAIQQAVAQFRALVVGRYPRAADALQPQPS